MIVSTLAQITGNTPLYALDRLAKSEGALSRVLAKLEYVNHAGSVKDRVASKMIEVAEKEGKLKKGSVIIEPTSGNTGIGLASVGASKGYRVILTMPNTMSEERRKLLRAYGAEIVLTEGAKGMAGAIEAAERLAQEIEGSFIPAQFDNPANALAHYESTAPEIWADCEGKVDIFVAGVGTGGTLTGVGKFLKEKNKDVKIVAVEPSSSPVLSKGVAGAHGLQGIGAGFIPKVLDRTLIDEVIAVREEEAYATARKLGKTEGLLAGISSGAALFAGLQLAKRKENAQKTVVVLLPDGGDRYLSTQLFEA